MLDYRVAIPSYHRHERITQTTLPLLQRTGVQMDRVTLFVNDAAEADRYRPAAERYGTDIAVIGGSGIRAAMNCMATYYPTGTPLIRIDDDLTRFVRRTGPKTLVDVPDLPAVFEEGFAAAGETLWGVYPVANPYFMKAKVRRSGLWFIYGSFFGYRVQNQPHELVHVDHGEDYERSIRFFEAHGAVTRLEHYSFMARVWQERGGMQDYRTPDTVDDGLRYVMRQWPHYTRVRYDAAGRPNLLLGVPKTALR
jgi:hypothetical protein